MDHILQYLADFGPYAGLLIAAFLEGPIVSFVAGTLIATGILNPYGALGVLVFKDLVLDTVWYGVGRFADLPYFAPRIEKWRADTKLGAHVLAPLERQWHTHPVRMMWVTKLAYGLSMYLLITAGIAGVPFKKFYLYTLPVTLFQFGGLMVLGYFLGTATWANVQNWWLLGTLVFFVSTGIYFGMPMFAKWIRRKFVEGQ